MYVKSTTVEPNLKREVAIVKLFGDWDLKIRVTYTVIQISQSEAK
jgi:hypothetical protein